MDHPLMRHLFTLLLFFYTSVCFGAPRVVVTIKPLHALVASVSKGIFEPELLLPDYASPHTFQLKPSTLKALQEADVVVWVGPSLELFMVKPLEQIHPSMGIITISKIPSLSLLPLRQGRAWQDSHEEHDHHHEHDLQEEGAPIDPHLWLSTDNAKIIVEYLANYFSKIDPANALQYQNNAKATLVNLTALKKTLTALLSNVHQEPFLVYHDGYQYFEKEFDLHGVGTMVLNPHLPLSANGLKTIQELIQSKHVKCVFRETEFNDTMVRNSLNNMGVKVAELDPLGARLAKGPDNYEKTLIGIGKTMQACLADK